MSEQQVTPIAVVGAGLMGAGIAEVLARAGNEVRLVDVRPGAAAEVADRLGLRGLTGTDSLAEAVTGAGLVLEAVSEDLEVKAELLRGLAELAPEAVIASNSSTFTPGELAPYAADPAKVLVAHFFNPATVVPLVELVPCADTDPAIMDAVEELLAAAGKTVVRLRREIPGFVANRLQAAVLREAIHLVETGVVDVAGLDQVMTASLGVRWSLAGPFRIADLGGLDIFKAVCERLWPDLDAATEPTWLNDLVAAGKLGAKSGAGCHTPAEPADQAYQQRLRERYAQPS
ncbi:3-hydroxyacyl-CoA dehydrogenase family protein [Naumannella sp. ID2617S]|nr:3-hydroxyacyl-CoA dehydrogenase family protein [Naumannella sp. ID2617S]